MTDETRFTGTPKTVKPGVAGTRLHNVDAIPEGALAEGGTGYDMIRPGHPVWTEDLLPELVT